MIYESFILELYFETFHFGISIALYCIQITCFKLLQNTVFQLHMKQIKILGAHCNNNARSGEKVFCS